MELLLWLVIAALALTVAALLIKIWLMKKSADEIRVAFAERIEGDTNTLIDLSSRDRHMRRLAAAINTQLKQLRGERLRCQQGDAELKQAITGISHDLRTPLTAICGYLELLESEEKSEPVGKWLDLISNRVESLRQMTDELFRYSVITTAQADEISAVSMREVLEENLAASYNALSSRGITPIITMPESKVERHLSRSALSRVFANVLSNAVKYSDGDLIVTMDEDGRIVFSNHAAGLSPITVGRLFDRFYTVETGRNSTGLGLSIARVLTERMGGAITADYDDGMLSITVSFPL